MASAVKDWLDLLDGLYPGSWAEPGGRVGFQAGDPNTDPLGERR